MASTPPNPARSFSVLVPLSLLAAPVSWALIYASGQVTAASFNDRTSNTMVLLLWLSAAATVAGLVVAILALRSKGPSRGLALLAALLNVVTLLVLLLLGLTAVVMS